MHIYIYERQMWVCNNASENKKAVIDETDS